ncbi:MAG: hemin uptake protein HemP [Hydrogenophaga sp.]|nr:hemin uptake protein HemP [Hydrogenophaga sp.]MCW5652658.1 hemin uptake protein HemP [Hydrogenophaga sp.]
MNQTPPIPPQSERPSQDTTATPATSATADTPVLASATLLRGQKSVAIDHNGLLYRLQATRQGKLILTK